MELESAWAYGGLRPWSSDRFTITFALKVSLFTPILLRAGGESSRGGEPFMAFSGTKPRLGFHVERGPAPLKMLGSSARRLWFALRLWLSRWNTERWFLAVWFDLCVP